MYLFWFIFAFRMKFGEKIEVLFFRTSAGNEPVREMLSALPEEEKKIIGSDLRAVQWRYPLGMPTVRAMKHGIFELRSELPNRIARILFVYFEEKIVLLHGFIKKTQKTPPQDLETALRRFKELKQ